MNPDELKALRETMVAIVESPEDTILNLLEEAGWSELVEEDEAAAVGTLFHVQGTAGGRAPILDGVILREAEVAADIVAYPVAGIEAHLVRGTWNKDTVVAAVDSDGSIATFAASTATFVGVESFDRFGDWSFVTPHAPRSIDLGPEQRRRVVSAARRALSAELIGGAEAMLELAVEHTSTREQYGRPLAAFQTVRHRLADCRASIDGAKALLDAAFEQTGDSVSGLLAKAQSGRAARLTAAHVTQVFGAVGSTREHVLPRYVARSATLDHLFGDAGSLIREYGRLIVAEKSLPGLRDVIDGRSAA